MRFQCFLSENAHAFYSIKRKKYMHSSESHSFQIQLVTVFMCFEFEAFIKGISKLLSVDLWCKYDFEVLFRKTYEFGEWISEIHFILLSLLLKSPFYTFTTTTSLLSNPSLASTATVVIFLLNSHFIAGVRCDFSGQISVPTNILMRFFKGTWPILNFY